MKARSSICRIMLAAVVAPCLATPVASAQDTLSIKITPTVPGDIPGGAPDASLSQAASFAWQEFIALNWPATVQTGAPGTRDTPSTTRLFGDPSYTGPLVWQTFRSKVEIFPGKGLPPGTSQTVSAGKPPVYQCNYDALPQYNYATGPASGANPPWINLDESSQIGLDYIFAGVADDAAAPLKNQILFLAKANRVEFNYICPKGWWSQKTVKPYLDKTSAYVQKYHTDPPAGASDLVSFPNGTIEIKAAWRQLGKNEDPSRYYTTTARYYVSNSDGTFNYVDRTLALVGLHIIQKTPSAPYFIFATFEQADNIVDDAGHPVESVDGNYIGKAKTALTPEIFSTNATPTSAQSFVFAPKEFGAPGKQLYYSNTANTGLVTGNIRVNRRKHLIAPDIIRANAVAHAIIGAYMAAHFPNNPKSPWAYYKLVSVQSHPMDKPVPGETYDKPDAATYYQANSTIETDYNLQVFSGRFYLSNPMLLNNLVSSLANTITDFSVDGKPFKNVGYKGKGYDMGGCMGCHGNAQYGGADFSFILAGGRDSEPDTIATFKPVIVNKVTRFLSKKQHDKSGK